jgi:hypothetical protein
MKKIFTILFTMMILAACSKSADAPKSNGPETIELDIVKLNSYIGQPFDVVHKSLEKNALEIKTVNGEKSFKVGANSGPHNGLSVEIKERSNIVYLVDVTYDGVVGGKKIGDPYEVELWHYLLNKAEIIYGKSSTRVYASKPVTKLFKTDEELIQFIKDNGTKAAFVVTWDYAPNILTVAYTDVGRLLFEFRAEW